MHSKNVCFVDELRESDFLIHMKKIGLDEMKSVKLMSRIDTKYVMHQRWLIPVLEKAHLLGYQVLHTGNVINGYDSIYYDSDDLYMFRIHHNRQLKRQKVRCRTYIDSGISFFEIKNKTNKGRTNKVRMQVSDFEPEFSMQRDDVMSFYLKNRSLETSFLSPSLQTYFHRITLVNPEKTERITIDLDVKFKNLREGRKAGLNDVVILELKQDGRYVSMMQKILMDLRIKPFHLSKYCMGITLTYPDVTSNRFKRKLHLINKIKQRK